MYGHEWALEFPCRKLQKYRKLVENTIHYLDLRCLLAMASRNVQELFATVEALRVAAVAACSALQ